MSWANDMQSIAGACLAISNEVGSPSGFVSVRKLLERFGVSIYIRPLLVEGMLASLPVPESCATKLTVLLDSDTFSVTNKDIAAEAEDSPLPTRFRATVAHELLHSLAFRPSHFGLRLQNPIDDDDAISELIKTIEGDTERLTPLLLWPERAVNQLIATRQNAVTPAELANLATKLGISRQMVVTRLRLRRLNDGLIYARWLADIGIGIGEWIAEKIAVFHKWPLFVNFDRNIVPNFLFDIAAQDRLPANAVFDEDARFVLSGGDYSRIFLKADAGLKEIRSVEKMDVVVEVENGAQKPGSEFFFVVRKKRLEDKVPAPHAYDEHQA